MSLKDRRYQLHDELKALLGSNNVYFQPPESALLRYPCIVYTREAMNNVSADNSKYNRRVRYNLTLIGDTPDSDLIEAILNHFPYCSYDRYFASDNLSHDAFTLYY